MAGPEDDMATVIARERALLDPAVRTSPAAVAELLDPEYTEIGASGRWWTRTQMIAALAAEERSEPIQVSQLRGRVVAKDLVLLTYLSAAGGRRAWRTSVWRRRDGVWRVLHHQGTLLAESGDDVPVMLDPERE